VSDGNRSRAVGAGRGVRSGISEPQCSRRRVRRYAARGRHGGRV